MPIPKHRCTGINNSDFPLRFGRKLDPDNCLFPLSTQNYFSWLSKKLQLNSIETEKVNSEFLAGRFRNVNFRPQMPYYYRGLC